MQAAVGVTLDKCKVLVGYKYMVDAAWEESLSRTCG